MKLRALTQSQRRQDYRYCDCCGNYKKNTAPVLVTPNPGEAGVRPRLDICSGCLRSMLEAAVRGRTAER